MTTVAHRRPRRLRRRAASLGRGDRRRSPASWRRSGCCTATWPTEQVRPDDPTARLDGVRVPSGIPKPLSEAQVTSLLDAVLGNEPLAPPRPGAARVAVRHRRPDLGGGRAVGRRHRLRRAARAAVRQGVEGAHRAVRIGGGDGARRVVLAVGPGPAGARPVEASRRRRGGVPQPARRPAQPAGRLAGDQQVRRPGRASPITCRRTCCATRAPRTCSTTAPTCGSCRRCSVTPRSRPPRSTPGSARNGCGRSTGPPTRGRCTR